MELTRTLSHVYASSSGMIRPSRASTNVIARVPVARRALRASIRPSAVASFAAPNASAVGTAPQKADRVMDIPSSEAFDELLKANPDKLIVLMCKATGCRPCKAFRTKFVKLANHYTEGIFCEILGDRSESTRNLMRSLKVRATPTFVFFRGGENIHMHSGINGQKMIDALKIAVRPEEAGFCEEVKFAAELFAKEEEAH